MTVGFVLTAMDTRRETVTCLECRGRMMKARDSPRLIARSPARLSRSPPTWIDVAAHRYSIPERMDAATVGTSSAGRWSTPRYCCCRRH